MTPLRCACGHPIAMRMAAAGFGYVAEFVDLNTERDVERCPSCEVQLHQALHGGDLRDLTAEVRP